MNSWWVMGSEIIVLFFIMVACRTNMLSKWLHTQTFMESAKGGQWTINIFKRKDKNKQKLRFGRKTGVDL